MGIYTGPRTQFYRSTKKSVTLYVCFGIAAVLISAYYVKTEVYDKQSSRRRLFTPHADCAALEGLCPDPSVYEADDGWKDWTPTATAATDPNFKVSWRGSSPCGPRGQNFPLGYTRRTGLHVIKTDADNDSTICVCPRAAPTVPIKCKEGEKCTPNGYRQASTYSVGANVSDEEIWWIKGKDMTAGVWIYPAMDPSVDLGRKYADEVTDLTAVEWGQLVMSSEATEDTVWESQRCANTQSNIDECCNFVTSDLAAGSKSHPSIRYYLPDAFNCPCDSICGGMVILHILGFVYICLSLAIVCDEFFVPALEVLVEKLNVSPAMAGATWMAAGGSMPELFCSLFGAFFEDTVGFATIVGSAVFNILFVIGFCAIFANEPLKLTWWPLARDTTCYVTSLLMIGVFFGWATHVDYKKDVNCPGPDCVKGNYRCNKYAFLAGDKGGPDGKGFQYCTAVYWWEALILIAMYAGYCVVIKYTEQLEAAVNGLFFGSKAPEPADKYAESGDGSGVEVQLVDPQDKDEEKNEVGINPKPKAGDSLQHAQSDSELLKKRNQDNVEARENKPGLEKYSTLPNADCKPVTGRTQNQKLSTIHTQRGATEINASNKSRGRSGRAAVKSRKGTGKNSVAAAAGFRGVNFRAGISAMMTKDYSLMQLASVHMVTRISGDVDETWKQIDEDGDGNLSLEELASLVKKLNGTDNISSEELNQCFNELDADKDGKITKDEFKKWYLAHERKICHDIEDVFTKLDKDDSGSLSRAEMKEMLEYINGGKEFTEEDMNKMMDQLDHNGDDHISREEFIHWYEHAYFFEFSASAKMREEMEEGIKLWMWPSGWCTRITYLIHLPIMFLLYYTIPDVRKPCGRKFWWLAFLMSIVWLGLLSYIMLPWVITIGVVVGIPSFVMGFTFIAAGTSVPDLVTSVIVAKQGHGDMAVSSSLGSNIFDLLMGLPIPWLLYAITKASSDNAPYAVVVADGLEISLLMLMGMLVGVITIVAILKWTMTKMMGMIMFVLYIVFLVLQLSLMTDWGASNC